MAALDESGMPIDTLVVSLMNKPCAWAVMIYEVGQPRMNIFPCFDHA